jgi:prevent-host-death family protein
MGMGTVNLTDLRNDLGQVVRRVAYTGEETIITASGKQVAVIISLADYERLQPPTPDPEEPRNDHHHHHRSRR